MDLGRLKNLKQKLLHEERLSVIWQYFMDHFADHEEFIVLGVEVRDPFLEAVLDNLSQQMFPRDGAISNLLLAHHPGEQFFHGGFSMGGRVGGLLYFEDIHMGLAAVTDRPPSIDVKYARFARHPVPPLGEPSEN